MSAKLMAEFKRRTACVTELTNDNAALIADNVKLAKRMLEAEQRHRIASDNLRLFRELLAEARDDAARWKAVAKASVRADEQQTLMLRKAS